MLRPSSFPPYSQSCSLANILIPLEQIPRVDLIGHVGQVVAPAVGNDHVAAGLEGRQVARDLAPEELGRVEGGLAGHHGAPLALTRIMMPWMEEARKLSGFDFVIRRYTPTTGLGSP